MKKMENEINAVSEIEAGANQRMCEIRFDCLVTMYEMGSRKSKEHFFGIERQLNPQWFRNQSKITLESIKYSDEFELGRQLKIMLQQLENHIRQYEGK